MSPRFPTAGLLLAAALLMLSLACDEEDTAAPRNNEVVDQADAGDAGDGEGTTNNDDQPLNNTSSDAGIDVDADDEDDASQFAPGTLLIDPPRPTIRLTVGGQESIDFSARYVDDEGHLEEVEPTWALSDLRLGAIDANTGVFTTAGAGGQVRVMATWQGASASTPLSVVITETWFDANVAPEEADRFDGPAGEEPSRAPELIYPEEGTRFFQNIRGATIQWNTGSNTLFRVTFEAPFIEFVAYTTESVWTPPEDLWETLVRSLGGEPVEVVVEGIDGAGEVNLSRNTTSFSFSGDVVQGAIYYWSTADSGIMRLPVGDTAPEPFFTPGNPSGSPCVGCHTVSRDGRRVAFNTAPIGLPLGPLMAVDAEDPTQRLIDIPQNINGMQPTFSPDGDRIISGWQGTLTERWTDATCADNPLMLCASDADCGGASCVSGREIQTLPRPEGMLAAFPDWAPDGSWLATAVTRSAIGFEVGFELSQGGIAVIRRDGDFWGIPNVILEPSTDPNTNNTTPAISPDSRWIAFSHTGEGLEDVGGNIVQSGLFVISPNTRVPVPLTRADRGLGGGNTWPKWAPFSGELMWLAFSSARPYGKVPTSADGPQIWITAIDPARAAQGLDPSYPAFWLPYQSPSSGNHIPFWAVYVKEP